MTVIEATGATGYLLPPLIIFKGKEHPDTWYKELPKDWSIAVSPNGWTTDEIGRYWVEKVFNLHTKDRCVGAYQLLVLDGHNSHSTAQFEHFCGENKIIPLYLPPHSSHLLQPLDVGCFGPLKKAYGSQVQGYIRAGVNHVDKADFLKLYQTVRPHAFRAENITSSFAAAGLVPYNPDQVMDFELLNVGTPPPPSSSAGSTSSAVATPTTTRQLVKRSALLQRIWERRSRSPPSPLKNAISGIIKGCHMAMGNAALLEREVGDLRAANRRQVQKRETTKKVLQKDGILTRKEVEKQIEEAIQADQADQATAEASDRPRKKAPPTCSDCHTQGHIRTQCKSR